MDIQFLKETGKDLIPLAIAFVVYLLGLRSYHLQREYELLRKRYLDEGLDAFASDIQHALTVFNTNWRHSLTVLNFFRDVGSKMNMNMLSNGFIDLDMSQFRMVPNHRVGRLVGSQIFWDVEQLLFASVSGSIDYFMHDLPECIRHCLTNEDKQIDREEMSERLKEEAEKHRKETYQFYFLLTIIQDITYEFEKIRFSQSAIDEFKDSSIVQEKIHQLKQQFSSELP